MEDEEAFLRRRIAEETAKLAKLRAENREHELQQIMWGCLEGKINVNQLCGKDLLDLNVVIQKHLNQVNIRLSELAFSSSSLPPPVSCFPVGYDDLPPPPPPPPPVFGFPVRNVDVNLNQSPSVEEDNGEMTRATTNMKTDGLAITDAADAPGPSITNNHKS